MKITITEALSEINLIKKKIEGKKTTVLSMLVRPKHMKDHFESEGGSVKKIMAETQAIKDLFERLQKIRGSIAKANIENEITIASLTMSIFDWLTWKREIAESAKAFCYAVYSQAKRELDQAAREPKVYKDDEGKTHLLEILSNVDLPTYLAAQEHIVECIEKLDGQLSLKNATITIDI